MRVHEKIKSDGFVHRLGEKLLEMILEKKTFNPCLTWTR